MPRPTIGIIGMGPVGTILAAHLVNSEEDVVVEDIYKPLLFRIRDEGLKVSGIKGLTEDISVEIDETKTATSISELADYELGMLFIATKACFLKDILPELKQIHKPEMKIVSYQNGLDNEQKIVEALGIDTAYRVVINYAGSLVAYGETRMNWFQPPNYVGALHKGKYTIDDTTKYIAEIMTTSRLKTEETPDIKKHVWEKTILNSALCSICGMTGQTMKEAMEYEDSCDLAVKILKEGLEVAKADGYDFGIEALSRFTSYLEKGGAHKPSMRVDVEKENPTEVEFMSGAIARVGELYGVPTPVNSTLTKLLKASQHRYLSHKKK